MMQELLEEMPELQEDERSIVSTRVFNAPLTKFLATKGVSA
jgi:hypothetical protein